MLQVLADWVERDLAPGTLQVVTQQRAAPFTATDSRPLCRWPAYPHYVGGERNQASSYRCRVSRR
jgi:hypothetical protein